jgi:hypothetical protein
MSTITSMSDLDITYQEIVAEYVNSNFTSNPEKRIWAEIGSVHYDLADTLTDVYAMEAVCYAIENGKIPHANPTWQSLVVGIAYNMIQNSDWAEYYLAHTSRTEAEVQKAIDLAMFQIIAHGNFKLNGFNTITA